MISRGRRPLVARLVIPREPNYRDGTEYLTMYTDMTPVPGVHFYRVDISKSKKVEEACADVKRVHGDATVLINNAGIANKKSTLDVIKPSSILKKNAERTLDYERRNR